MDNDKIENMKISTFIFALLFVGMVITVMLLTVRDTESFYGVEVNTSLIEGKYDYASSLNDSIYPIQESIDKISDQDQGWLSKVGAGFTGIISAVILLPSLVWKTFFLGGSMITGGLGSLLIPASIIAILLLALTIWGVIKLIEFFQRWPL